MIFWFYLQGVAFVFLSIGGVGFCMLGWLYSIQFTSKNALDGLVRCIAFYMSRGIVEYIFIGVENIYPKYLSK